MNILSNRINGDFKGKDVVSLDQFSQRDIKILFSLVPKMRQIAVKTMPSKIIAGKIVVMLFYEPSSRTFGSFSTAIKQIGGQTVEILNPQQFSSVVKGETFEDTIRVFEAYSDAIIIRHPETGSAQKAAGIAKFVPIINAGDGIGEHPTQALADLYTIKEKFKRLNNLHVVFFGELAHYRSVNSLAKLLALYPGIKMSFVSPPQVGLSPNIKLYLKEKKIKIQELQDIDDVIGDADVLYVSRVKKEFMPDDLYKKIQGKYRVDNNTLSKMKKESIIMHPLPRVSEILMEVDSDPRAVYLRSQIRNGTYVRMALLALVLGKV
ncbi:MAG: aspartate carbamoyltransferase [Patescibacteria group bacterium]